MVTFSIFGILPLVFNFFLRSLRRIIIPYNKNLKSLAKALRGNMTLSEVLLWNELKQRKMLGYDFDRQRPIDQYIVDFYCKDLLLAIEIDGDSHHSIEASKNDFIRHTRLESLGIRFLRFEDAEVKSCMDEVIARIQEWIEANHNIIPG